MNPGSPVDTPLEEFGRVFGPNGLMEKFFRGHLKDKVSVAADGWYPIDPRLELSADALTQFRIARGVKNAFFGSGADEPLVKFDLQPFDLSSYARGVFVNIEGQRVRYEQGPTSKSYPITWPGPEPGQVRVELDAGGEVVSPKSFGGPWALFRLLDDSRLSRVGPSPTTYRLTFLFGSYEASFDLRAYRSVNAFDFDAWRSFECPESL
jgi:type VI secretion system protein ImpL